MRCESCGMESDDRFQFLGTAKVLDDKVICRGCGEHPQVDEKRNEIPTGERMKRGVPDGE